MTELEEINKRLKRLEVRMNYLFRRLGINDNEVPEWETSETVWELLRSGDKMAAIKAFMHETGASLKDAKSYIESLKA